MAQIVNRGNPLEARSPERELLTLGSYLPTLAGYSKIALTYLLRN